MYVRTYVCMYVCLFVCLVVCLFICINRDVYRVQGFGAQVPAVEGLGLLLEQSQVIEGFRV